MVLFVYVDNSNVWIEGQRLSAVRRGLASDAADAMHRKIVDADWRYDFGRLYSLACPDTAAIGRSILFGSRPPANDSLWELARNNGFQVELFDRNAQNREKEVDVSLSTTIMEDSYEYMNSDRGDKAILLSGDRDFAPTVRSLARRGIPTHVVFWKHATSHVLADAARDVDWLDPYLAYLAGL